MSDRPRGRRWRRRVGVALAALLVVEGGARLYSALAIPHYDYLLDEQSLEARLSKRFRIARGGERRGEASVSVNALGFRGPPPVRERPGQPLVLCIGNGATHGGPVPDDATWPARLDAELDAALPGGAAVANLGVEGAAVVYGRERLLPVALAAEPDVVVVAFAGLNEALRAPATEAEHLARHGGLWDVAHSLASVELVERAAYVLRNRRAGEARVLRVPVPAYREALGAMVEAIRAAGARPILVAEATPFPALPGFWEPEDLLAYRAALEEVASRLRVPFLDPLPLLAGEPLEHWYQRDGVLYTPEANARLAGALAPMVLELLAGAP